MLTTGTWCDNIIIQAVANAQNCAIHITESDINKPDGTIITPVNSFIGSCTQLPHTPMNATQRTPERHPAPPEMNIQCTYAQTHPSQQLNSKEIQPTPDAPLN